MALHVNPDTGLTGIEAVVVKVVRWFSVVVGALLGVVIVLLLICGAPLLVMVPLALFGQRF